ncbi:MAG TPA: response regulator [Anaeromyxobacteraceae bacterium]|nr:response regulator [Anaeromyxobacteraceae bacterium]
MLKATTGELLVQRGVVTSAVVARAEAAAKKAGLRLCSQLLAMKVCDELVLAQVLAEKHGLPGVDLSGTVVPLEALDRVPRPVAEADLILPLSLEGDRLHLAMASPRDSDKILDEVRFVTGLEVSPYIAVEGALRQAIRAAYDAREKGEALWRGARAGPGLAQVAVVLPGQGTEEVLEVSDDEVLEAEEFEPIDEAGPVPAPATEATEADEPLRAAPEPEIEIAVGGDEGEVVATVSGGGGPKRVLVVDDEPEIRLLVERTLAGKGFQVETAADGEEGLKKIGALLPDLVLLDAMLPKLHGFEVCRKARSDQRTRQVPIIIMTALYRGWRFAQDARENYGAEDYIEKPFRIDDLLRRVEAVLESTAGRGKAGGPSTQPQFKKGKELLLAGQLDGAVAAFEEATRVDPFSAEAHYHLAKALRAKGDAFRAMTAFEKAAELRQGFFQALRSLAALYTEKGFRRKAAETLERALASAPDAATRDAIKSDLLRLL